MALIIDFMAVGWGLVIGTIGLIYSDIYLLLFAVVYLLALINVDTSVIWDKMKRGGKNGRAKK